MRLLTAFLLLSLVPGPTAGLSAESGAPPQNQVDPNGIPGMVTRAYVDSGRLNWSGTGPRPLRTAIWYPVDAASTRETIFGAPVSERLFVPVEVAPGAGISDAARTYPLIVMSHGTGGSAMMMFWLGRQLAAHGYIVAAVNHHGNTSSEKELAAQGFLLYWERARDLQVVIDRLLQDSLFGGRIDRNRIGALGFSLGGYTVIAAAGARFDQAAFDRFCSSPARDFTCGPQNEFPEAPKHFATLLQTDSVVRASLRRSGEMYRDTRIKAVFAISPALGSGFTEKGMREVSIPVEIVVGQADSITPPRTNARRYASLIRRAHLTVLPGGIGHYTFLHECTALGRERLPICRDGTGVDRAAVHDSVAAMAIRFFDHALPQRESLFPQAPSRAGYAITGVRILDPVTGRYSAPSAVQVSGGRIESILPAASYRPALADSTIDMTGKFLLPGLIDGHVHFSLAGPIRANALATVQAGFTTVADLGARGLRVLRFRDSVNAGTATGPRILAAGLWIGIQGGVCEFSGLGIAGGPDAFAARVRENVQAGADLIKLCVSGWPAESFANPDKYELSDSMLSVSVGEAHRAGKLVIAHDLSAGGVRAGLRAGVDGLAHAAFVDSALAVEMKRRNVFLIPTLASLTGGDSSQVSRSLIGAVGLAHRIGVTIVFGTDAGVIRHGDNAIEFAALQGAGLTPLDAIRAATINAARAFRLADSVGTVKPGMVADLIVLNTDPLKELGALKSPALVMARGRVVPNSRP